MPRAPTQARVALYDLAVRLVDEAYDPLMRCLKAKFVRDVDEAAVVDHVRFMSLAAFLMSIHRLREEDRLRSQRSTDRAFAAGPVAATLDVWSFAFVVKCCDAWLEALNAPALQAASGLLKEMVLVRCGLRCRGGRVA